MRSIDRSPAGHSRAPVRRAGLLPLPRDLLAWSMAEGTRGRRWRSNRLRDGRLVEVLMLEVSLAGRPTRLELSTAAGLLTLHPEPDESMIHGNVVRDAGVEPVALAWSPDHELFIAGNPIPVLVALRRRYEAKAGEGLSADWPVVAVDAALRPEPTTVEARRDASGAWTVAAIGADPGGGPASGRAREPGEGIGPVRISAVGLPVVDDAEEWALEAE